MHNIVYPSIARQKNKNLNLFFRNLLQEQAKLVLEENSILMQEIDLKDRRIDEILHEFQSEGEFQLV